MWNWRISRVPTELWSKSPESTHGRCPWLRTANPKLTSGDDASNYILAAVKGAAYSLLRSLARGEVLGLGGSAQDPLAVPAVALVHGWLGRAFLLLGGESGSQEDLLPADKQMTFGTSGLLLVRM